MIQEKLNLLQRGLSRGSINIGLDGNFAPWVGTLIPDIKQAILLVTGDGREEEVMKLIKYGKAL